jgi:hypothetical protein
MSANRLSMRKIREVLRLKLANNLSDRKIAQSCNISRHAVTSYLERAKQASLSWPLPDALSDVELDRLLFPEPQKPSGQERIAPDLLKIHQELQKRMSPCSCCGRNTENNNPRATNTAGSAISTGTG